MAYTNTWDEAAPDGSTEAAADLDTIIQNLKIDVRERLNELLGTGTLTADPVLAAYLKLLGSATSKIVPGATSLSLRNNADNTDNLLVTDAGDVTVRGTLTSTGTIKQGATDVSLDGHTHALEDATGATMPNEEITFPHNLKANRQAYTPIYDAGTSGAAKTLDWNNGMKQKLELTADCTLTFSNLTVGAVYQLIAKQDVTGGWEITWPASVDWGTNGTPISTSTASKADVFTLLVYSATQVWGFVGGYGFSP